MERTVPVLTESAYSGKISPRLPLVELCLNRGWDAVLRLDDVVASAAPVRVRLLAILAVHIKEIAAWR